MVRETHCGGSGDGGGHERERWALIYPLGRGERKEGESKGNCNRGKEQRKKLTEIADDIFLPASGEKR
jgi:hypothetical protein